ncbi:WD40 repeat-like protein, partial [Ramicandelaber brevisporus]
METMQDDTTVPQQTQPQPQPQQQGPGKLELKTCFKAARELSSIFTGGKALLTPDERILLSTVDDDVLVTDLSNGKLLGKLNCGESEGVTTFAITPDAKYVITASKTQQMRVWLFNNGQVVRKFRAHDAPVIVMTVDATSTLVATGSADSTVKVWDIAGGFCTHNLGGHGGIISALTFMPQRAGDSRLYLASGADDATVRVWNLRQKPGKGSHCLAVLQGHSSVVRGLAFTPDQKLLLSGARDQIVNVWDVDKIEKVGGAGSGDGSKALVRTIPIYESIESLGVLDEGTVNLMFYTGGERGVIRLWDVKKGTAIFPVAAAAQRKHALSDVLYLRSSGQLVGVTTADTLEFHSIRGGMELVRHIIGSNDEVIDLAYMYGGTEPNSTAPSQTHLVVASNSEQLRVYDMRGFGCDVITGASDMVLCIDVLPLPQSLASVDGRPLSLIAAGSKDSTVRIYLADPAAPHSRDRYKLIAECAGHAEAICATRTSKHDHMVSGFVATASQDRTLKVWDAAPLFRAVVKYVSAPSEYHSVSPVKLSSIFTMRAHEKDINTVAIAPNDAIIATGAQDKTAKLWDASTGAPIGALTGHKRGVWCVKFSPVDQVLATCSGDKTIKLWSLNDRTCIKTFEGHTNTVLNVAFVTAGTQLVSTAADGLVKLWTIKTNECVGTLDNHTERIWALAVREDGGERYMATGAGDAKITLWEDTTAEELDAMHAEQAEILEKEQLLSNYIMAKDYRNAIALALALEQPFRLLKLFQATMASSSSASSTPAGGKAPVLGDHDVDLIITTLSPKQLGTLLKFVRDWNTNAKHSRVAQAVLYVVLANYSPEALVELPEARDLISGLLPFSQRHFHRLDMLMTNSYLIDHTLHAMD